MPIQGFLDRASVTPAFRAGLTRFLAEHGANAVIRFGAGSPPVKVERTLTRLLELHPEWEIESVEITARSGCEYYRGLLVVETPQGQRTIRFHWDCRWKAEEMGWRDAFGFPDQIRAVREFGHDCFRGWEVAEGAADPMELLSA